MIKNGKYFIAPQKSEDNFKVLFSRLAAEGVGRPADRQGSPDGPWTPETLAAEISAIDDNRSGVDLRTVQLWFQENDNGISTDNIRWLARIFGCNDPEATSLWQAELRAAKDRLATERRSRKQKLQVEDSTSTSHEEPNTQHAPALHLNPAIDPTGNKDRVTLALLSEAMFAGPNSLNLPIVIWGSLSVLWFLAFSLGIESITYTLPNGVTKQVGFIWSMGWNIGEAIFLPMFLITVSGRLNAWKSNDRSDLIRIGGVRTARSWSSRVTSFLLSFWAILLICFVVIFVLQWAGVYLYPLLRNDPDVAMIDWLLIALVRPEVLSIDAAIVVSFLAFLYSGMIYWIFFTGLLLLYIIAGDFSDICEHCQNGDDKAFEDRAFHSGTSIMQSTFRCTILGIFIALSIKLNAAYLVSDAESLSAWLIQDASFALGFHDDRWRWIKGSPSPFLTSFLLLFLLCYIFFACLLLVTSALARTLSAAREKRQLQLLRFRMALVVLALSAAFMLVGQFHGFSIVLCIGAAVSVAGLLWHPRPPDHITRRT